MLRRVISKYINEVKKATTPGLFNYNEHLTLWDFTKEDSLKQWICVTDQDIGGYSRAKLEPNGKGDSCAIACFKVLMTVLF